MGRATGFEDVPSRYDGVALEEKVLALWREHDMFNEAQRRSEGRPLYCWNEGPPTANGRPGIHHVLARTFKDVFPRFKHMQGYHCPRKAGWDTHGLPVEHEIEKELGIFDKAEIERRVGVAEFTRRCRESVMRYIGDWEKMTERMGFWVNMRDAYYTLDNAFIESVWWLLRQIWDKGLIYQGYKVVPYDPRIGATLSSHEVALGYKEVEDPSIHVRFPVEGEERTSFLVWTTTPWTLPSNLALAVHPEVDYVYARVKGDGEEGETLILAEALAGSALRDDGYTVEKRVKGADLEGMRYVRLFDHLPAEGPICQVWAADFVTVEDGTGIVHCAPAYGEDDIRLCRAKGLPVVHGVGLDGCFVPEVEPVAGKFFKDADPILIALLEERGLMYRSERYRHNYPHGWRTGDPLIYYAKHAWYIETSRFRDRMVALNRTINWVPETIRDGRFGNWLANNVDWALSRERFWGTPLPVWIDGEGGFMCIGSVAELESLCGRSLRDVDLHRPRRGRDHLHPSGHRAHLAARAGGHRLLVRLRGDVLRAVPLPLREPGAVREPLPPPTTSARPSTRPAAGSIRCTRSPPWCRTAWRTGTASASPTSWTRTAGRCRSRRATSSTPTTSSTTSVRTPCAGIWRAGSRRRCRSASPLISCARSPRGSSTPGGTPTPSSSCTRSSTRSTSASPSAPPAPAARGSA